MLLAVAGRVWFKLLLTMWPGSQESGTIEDHLTAALTGLLGPTMEKLAAQPGVQDSPDWCAFCKRETSDSNNDLKVRNSASRLLHKEQQRDDESVFVPHVTGPRPDDMSRDLQCSLRTCVAWGPLCPAHSMLQGAYAAFMWTTQIKPMHYCQWLSAVWSLLTVLVLLLVQQRPLRTCKRR